jgi:hypothetical protein
MKFTLAFTLSSLILVGPVGAAQVPTNLIDAYLQVQNALAADTIDGVAAHARAIEAAAIPLGKDGETVAGAAKKLQAAKEIADARTAFGELSDALIGSVEKTRTALDPDVRIAFCPMVNKPWLQKAKEIRNPYYGASMLSCGSFNK